MGYTLQAPPPKSDHPMKLSIASSVYEASDNKITKVLAPRAWEGKRCFVLGGGESLRGFDFHKLDKEITLGINRTFEYYHSTLNYMMDYRFLEMIKGGEMNAYLNKDVYKAWLEYTGLKVILCPITPLRMEPNLYLVHRLDSKMVTLSVNEGIYGGNNSGFGGMMLAIALGANPIYLMGFDMQCKTATHWHEGYPGQTLDGQRKKNQQFLDQINEFAPWLKGMNIDVINLNPNSALECFPKKTIDEVL